MVGSLAPNQSAAKSDTTNSNVGGQTEGGGAVQPRSDVVAGLYVDRAAFGRVAGGTSGAPQAQEAIDAFVPCLVVDTGSTKGNMLNYPTPPFHVATKSAGSRRTVK